MRLFSKVICFILLYLISDSKWVLVQSDDTSATPPPSSGGDGSTVKTDQDASATTQAENGKKTPVKLHIKQSSGTAEFDYKKDDKVVTYTAKDKYAFKSVKTGKNGDIVVWSTDKPIEYAIKVVLIGKGKKEKIVIIYLLNGTKKSYKKDGKNKLWTEYDSSQKIPVSLNVDIGKDTDSYACKVEQGVRTFTPKEGFVFNEVMYTLGTSQTMWKTTNEAEYANKVELECKRAKIHLEDGSEIVFTFTNSRWQKNTQASTQKSTTDGSGTTPASQTGGGGTTGTDASCGGPTKQSTPVTQ